LINYVLSDAAETDLRGIIRYTRKQWGDAQVRRYIARLDRALLALRPVKALSLT